MAKIKGNKIVSGIMWGIVIHVALTVVLPQLRGANLSNLFNFNVAATPDTTTPTTTPPATTPPATEEEEEPMEEEEEPMEGEGEGEEEYAEEPMEGEGGEEEEYEEPMAGGAFGGRTGGGRGGGFGGGRSGMLARVKIGGL